MLLAKVFPFLGWFEDYDASKLRTDALAGLTVALVLIPQSMAYAQLAGLPAYYGLYAAFLPPMIASLFGSSRQLATGPVAVVSLMSAASLEPLATAGSPEFIAYSILLALIVGLFQFSLGVLKLGLVVNFLSHPVVNGFTNAAAIIIASSQFSKFFGVYVDSSEHHYETMIRVAQAAMDYTHWPTLAFGVGAVAIMAILKKINPRIPSVLIAVAITTVISYVIGYNNDVKVPVASVQIQGLRETVTEFNRVVDEVNTLGKQRAALGKELDLLKKETAGHGPSLELVEQESQIKMLTVKMAMAKEQTQSLREKIRGMKFEASIQGKDYTFYPKEDIPSGVETDKGLWRIKIGNSALKSDSLLLMGGGAVVGTIPEGLPKFAIPAISIKSLQKLLPTAIIISLLGFMEAIAIAKAMSAKTGQKLDPNQELIGQGLANILGSMGSSYACSGSFSRSAVNLQAGAVSGVSSVFTSVMVVITLLFLTPLLYHLPQAVLAAVIMMAVVGLVNTSGFAHAWKAQWYDGAISIITFLVTLAYAPHLDKGIMVGVGLSMGVFLYKSMRPVVASLSMHEDKVLKNAQHHRLKGCKHVAVVRFDGALFFANASYLDEQVIKFRTEMPDLRYILLEASGINDMDASGEEALALLVSRVRSAGIGFAISSAKGAVMAVLERTHLLDKIGRENFYSDTLSAVDNIVYKIHNETDLPQKGCGKCPLTHYHPQEV
ncbi:MAG: SulP family inorganic anion transporter [Proteobacteria bacterium]|nr:SulP family inorganic anion transporter [Desulfobulbaceae bacterium]MBU4151875.1 SulP family inorganic anion transporter [Pseudomonadota bacterium]MDP2105717.1 SulP family inorganic anion transporter [Desulfobulbaceae bacterium]